MSTEKIIELQCQVSRMLQEELPRVTASYEDLLDQIKMLKPDDKFWDDYQCVVLGPDESKVLLDYLYVTRSIDPKPSWHYDGIEIFGLSYWKSKIPGIHIGTYSEMHLLTIK